MPPRSQPTARQERLGTELRKLREAADMTARESAALLGTNPMQMSHMETGRAGISEARLRRLAAHYACPDTALIDALVDMATDRTRGWWEQLRGIVPPGFLDLAELEHHARFLRSIDIVHVPGLLQTEEYARTLFTYTVPELPPGEVDAWVAHRMRRRAVLEGAQPIAYEAVVHEAALRIRVGDRKLARKQLETALTLTDAEHVTLRVIPLDRDHFAGGGSAMLHAGGAVPKLDTVHRDAPHGGGFLDAEPQLVRFRRLFDNVRDAALGPSASRDLVHRIVREL